MKNLLFLLAFALIGFVALAQSNLPQWSPPTSTVVVDAAPQVTPMTPNYSYSTPGYSTPVSVVPQSPVPTTVIVVPQTQPSWAVQPQTIILNVDRPAWETSNNSYLVPTSSYFNSTVPQPPSNYSGYYSTPAAPVFNTETFSWDF